MDRRWYFLWVGMMVLLLAIWHPTQVALGQDSEKAATEGEEEEEEMTYLEWAIRSSGPIGAILFVMSFISVALTTMFVTELKHKNVMPPELIRNFEEKLREKRYQEAYDLVRGDSSFLGKVLAAGLSKVSGGYTAVVDAMQEVTEDETLKISHRLSWLAILGTIGPLLGLLGTVEGIIGSFRVIAVSKTQPKPSLLAEGISTSLFNTFEGLFVAIIATIAFMLLKNKAERVVVDIGLTASGLMSRFQSKG